jgi:curli production assembly/transport component CsgF
MKKNIKISTTVFCLCFLSQLHAGEIVYTPLSPSFGGHAINGNYLLSKANAQNRHKEHKAEKTYAERLQESLERSIMSKLVREITDLSFGKTDKDSILNATENQSFTSGDYTINVNVENEDFVEVEMINNVTGQITRVEVPRYG